MRFLLLSLVILPLAAADKPPGEKLSLNYEIPLWEESKVPLAKGDGVLDKPFLTVFLPPEGKRNSGSVVVAPGGGNIMLMYGAEGLEIAERYNEWGVTAFVLTYRLAPRYGDNARVLDGKRAIQLVRSRASQFQLDPAKVGFIGFSAGSGLGHLLGAAAGRWRPQCGGSRGPVQFASGLSRPGVWPGPGRSRRIAQEFPADVPVERRRRIPATPLGPRNSLPS